MLNTRQNYHHSKLPALGTIGYHPSTRNTPRHFWKCAELKGKWIVESYNLCDNVLPYSRGIHLVNIRSLANPEIVDTVSGFYFMED